MRTKLALIAVSSFAVSALCLGGAFAVGGGELGNAAFNFAGFDGFNQAQCDLSGPMPTATSRNLAWDGDGERATVALPADIHYQVGDGDQLTVKGDPQVLAHIKVHNGVVGLDCNGGHFHLGKNDRVQVTLPGRRSFRHFSLLGIGNMQLAGLSQPDVEITLAGSGDVSAQGKTDNLQVSLKGSGDMKMGDLAARNAQVSIAGSGDVELAPQQDLDVDIKGSGTVTLKQEPKKIDKSVAGSGRIVHVDGTVESFPRHGHYERHARAGDADLDAVIDRAIAMGREPDKDEIKAATKTLKARIKAQVAAELANEQL